MNYNYKESKRLRRKKAIQMLVEILFFAMCPFILAPFVFYVLPAIIFNRDPLVELIGVVCYFVWFFFWVVVWDEGNFFKVF